MKSRTRIALAILTLSAAGAFPAASPAKEPAVTEAPVTQAPVVTTTVPEKTARAVDRATLTPMHREIFDAVEAERKQVLELNERYLHASLPGERLAIQKEIESIKKSGTIAVLEIQLRYAESEGRTESAAQLASAIEAVRNPKRPRNPGPTLLEKMGTAAGR